ncbi:hypothetical protein QR297_12145 [Pseudomonas shirazica]|uniref:Uncharacterized protein n=1 Tax=Pseudomonas shirazica TaxID=1940636 RepID=A0ABY9SW59_9PSED|nr:hypothetical protein [Pseudomonas shirazica]WMY87550.1 hypothetical protein QR297_12145 [Pseudomonas shirazica]
MSSSPISVGASITDAVKFMSRLAGECETLADLLKQEISRALLTPELAKYFKPSGAWITSRTTDEEGWVYTGIGISLPIASKPKRSTTSHIVVQISLAGEGIEALDNREPLVHIGQWGWPIDFDEIQMGFPCDPVSGYDLNLESGQLFRWVHAEYDNEWCYSVRLTDINCPEDVKINIIHPLKSLLLRAEASQALAGTCAVRYVAIGENSGQYRVLPRQ